MLVAPTAPADRAIVLSGLDMCCRLWRQTTSFDDGWRAATVRGRRRPAAETAGRHRPRQVDIAAVPALELALDSAIRESARAFILDLRELEFMDCSGLRLILRARALLATEDRALAIVCPPGRSDGCSPETGIDDLLSLFTSPKEATAALLPGAESQVEHRLSARSGPRDTTMPDSSRAIAAITIRRHATHSSTAFFPSPPTSPAATTAAPTPTISNKSPRSDS